jgi:hypothetical protein
MDLFLGVTFNSEGNHGKAFHHNNDENFSVFDCNEFHVIFLYWLGDGSQGNIFNQ